jgi:hypothetical protein
MVSSQSAESSSVAGFVPLVVVAVVIGAILGGIIWAIEHFASIYLIVAFPIIGGAAAGAVLGLVARGSGLRNLFLIVLGGIVAGLVMYGVYHFASYYVSFRSEARTVMVEEFGGEPTDGEVDEFVNSFLQDAVADTGFMGFMKLAAQEGITITRTVSSSGSGFTLQGTLAWVYWAVEILLAMGIAASTAWRRVTQEA